MASKGPDAKSAVFITTYDDNRVDTAEGLIDILPEFLDYYTGTTEQEASKKWCEEPSGLINVTWEYDANFEWTGRWKTSDDEDMDELVDEDMGIHIELENMELIEDDDEEEGTKTRRMLTADDMTTKSFDLVKVPSAFCVHQNRAWIYPYEAAPTTSLIPSPLTSVT